MTWGQGSPPGWRKARKQVLDRDRHTCQLDYDCCIGYATQVDHITNVASTKQHRAEANDPNGLQAVCAPCHQVKTSREAAAGRLANPITWRRPPERHPGLTPRGGPLPPAHPST
jgi:5-methylcytosine-specific restriction endonuclease McrA